MTGGCRITPGPSTGSHEAMRSKHKFVLIFVSALVSSQTAQMAEGLDARRSYGSSDSNSTEEDGGSGSDPSHDACDMHKKIDVEGSVDDFSDSSRSSIDARMAERNERIRKRKMKRRGVDDSEVEESDEIFGRNPYRQLTMQEKFTPPRKKSKQFVPDSDENDVDDESGDDDDVSMCTPKRIYQTDWKVVDNWSTSLSLPEINRRIDAILARSLRSAGYVAEHVAKTKDTDRSYWKEAHVSALFNVAQPHC